MVRGGRIIGRYFKARLGSDWAGWGYWSFSLSRHAGPLKCILHLFWGLHGNLALKLSILNLFGLAPVIFLLGFPSSPPFHHALGPSSRFDFALRIIRGDHDRSITSGTSVGRRVSATVPWRRRLVMNVEVDGLDHCASGQGWRLRVHSCGFRLTRSFLDAGVRPWLQVFTAWRSTSSFRRGLIVSHGPSFHLEELLLGRYEFCLPDLWR
jgi:hypothetical protein